VVPELEEGEMLVEGKTYQNNRIVWPVI